MKDASDDIDTEMIDMFRQGNLLGILWMKGLNAQPLVDREGNYDDEKFTIEFEDPLDRTKTVSIMLQTVGWVSE